MARMEWTSAQNEYLEEKSEWIQIGDTVLGTVDFHHHAAGKMMSKFKKMDYKRFEEYQEKNYEEDALVVVKRWRARDYTFTMDLGTIPRLAGSTDEVSQAEEDKKTDYKKSQSGLHGNKLGHSKNYISSGGRSRRDEKRLINLTNGGYLPVQDVVMTGVGVSASEMSMQSDEGHGLIFCNTDRFDRHCLYI